MKFVEIEAAQEIMEALLDEVEQGTTVMLTRDGVAVAKMIPFDNKTQKGDAAPQQT